MVANRHELAMRGRSRRTRNVEDVAERGERGGGEEPTILDRPDALYWYRAVSPAHPHPGPEDRASKGRTRM